MMLRSLAAGLFAVLALVAGTGASERRPDVTFTDVTARQVAVVEWALALYDDAGLDLPPIDVVRHRSTDPCSGRTGAHHHEGGRSRIDLCTFSAGPLEEFLVLHELAHAWDQHSLTPDRRAAFLKVRGLTEWRNDDPERWHDRGAEQAAEIVVWGLIDRPVRMLRLDANSCTELLTGYRVLTGADPLHGYTDACQADGP